MSSRTTLKTVTLAPIPSAREATATQANAGAWRRERKAWRRSDSIDSVWRRESNLSNDSAGWCVQRAKWKRERMVGARQLAFADPMQSQEYASDADLLAACRRQDLRAFEHLYRT